MSSDICNPGSRSPGSDAIAGALPANTQLSYMLEPALAGRCVQLLIDSCTDVILTNVVAIDTEVGGRRGRNHQAALTSPAPTGGCYERS